MTGTWVRFRDGKGWGEWRFLPVSRQELDDMRTAVAVGFETYTRDKTVQEALLGFVPRTFAAWVLSKARYTLPSGLDGVFISFVSFQEIQVARGNWDSGPLRPFQKLETVYNRCGYRVVDNFLTTTE